jgi:hypothetical protein
MLPQLKPRWEKGASLLLLAFIAFCAFVRLFPAARAVHASTFTAASCNNNTGQLDIQAAINLASDGDTVAIPSGTCTMNVAISTTKQIFIQGTGGANGSGGPTITVNVPNTSYAFTITSGNTFNVSLSGINFVNGTTTCPANPVCGYVNTTGGGSKIPLVYNISGILPDGVLGNGVEWNACGGVFFNSRLYSTSPSVPGSQSGSLVYKPGGSCINTGNPSNWDANTSMGTADTNGTINLYIENVTADEIGQFPDCDNNCRIVLRHNKYFGSAGLTHGPTSTIGGRFVEIIANRFTYISHPNGTGKNLGRYFWLRDGTFVAYDNEVQQIIGGGFVGTSFVTSVEQTQSNVPSVGCCTGYMCYHQGAAGASTATQSPSFVDPSQVPADVHQLPDPIYIWNNIGGGTGAAQFSLINSGLANPCSAVNPATGKVWAPSDVVVAGRDIVFDAAKPGYTPCTAGGCAYPHPLAVGLETPIVAPPVFSLQGSTFYPSGTRTSTGVYATSQTLTLSEPLTAGATILYTTDGSIPTHGASCSPTGTTQTYSSALTIATTQTVSAIGCKSGFEDSYIPQTDSFGATVPFGQFQSYVIGTTPLATPVCTPGAGTYATSQSVTCTGPAGATICLNLGPSYPSTNGNGTCNSLVYSGAFTVAQTSGVQAVATKSGSTDSRMVSNLMVIGSSAPPAGIPTFSPVGGTYTGSQSVTISSTAFTVICYNTTGAPATNGTTGCAAGSTLYSGPVSVAVSETLFAVAGGTGFSSDSAVGSAVYVLTPFVSPSSVNFGNVAVGTMSVAVSLTFTNNTGASITNVGSTYASGVNYFTASSPANTCVGTLANGTSCSISVIFQPTGTGSLADTLQLNFTGASGSPVTAALLGTGTGVVVPGAPTKSSLIAQAILQGRVLMP